MKVIIAGSRSIKEYGFVFNAVMKFMKDNPNLPITEIVSGRAKGVDRLGEEFAFSAGIPPKYFPADWDNIPNAGIVRNIDMGDYSDILIAIWDGKSTGTKHMIDYMNKLGKYVVVFRYELDPNMYDERPAKGKNPDTTTSLYSFFGV